MVGAAPFSFSAAPLFYIGAAQRHQSPVNANELPSNSVSDLLDVAEDDWKVAQKRYEIIQPLLAPHPYKQNRMVVEARAAEFDLHAATV